MGPQSASGADVDVPVERAETGASEEGAGLAAACAEDVDASDALRHQAASQVLEQPSPDTTAAIVGMDNEVLHHAAEHPVRDGGGEADQRLSVPGSDHGVRVAEEFSNLRG